MLQNPIVLSRPKLNKGKVTFCEHKQALSVSYERNPIVEKTDPFDSLELCYGTANGTVRVLVQSPEHNTYGLRSLQLLQTYKGFDAKFFT